MKIKYSLKIFLKYSGINRVLISLFSHVIHVFLEENPEMYEKLKKRHLDDKNNTLLKRIKSKGSGVVLNGEVTITHPLGMVLGNNVHIGNNAYIFSRGGVHIGDNTHISRNLVLYSSNHQYQGNCLPFDSTYVDKPVYIGRNVWIGMNVNIIPGVKIGDGAIIGMGVTVSKNVKPFEIIGNPPNRVLKSRNSDHYNALLQSRQFGGVNGKRLNQQKTGLFHTDASSKAGDVFFVLGTGRSGSTAISRILSSHSGIICLHEPKFQLLRLSTLWLHKEITAEKVEQELSALFCESTSYPPGCYGESDQKLMPFIPQISQMLPDSKFIWLIRNAEDTVNSTYSRGWFSDIELGFSDEDRLDYKLFREVYSDYRPHADKIGVMTSDEWKNMSAFERNCWYWSYWNGEIEKLLSKIDSSRYIKIKLENIHERLSDIQNFLEINPENIQSQVSNVAEKRHKLHTTRDWTTDMKKNFEKWCGNSDLYGSD